MKKFYLPLITLAAGSGLAFLAAGVSSLFFALLPILAFFLGYLSSWRWGLLCGFLLFASYTFVTALMWDVPYAFVGIPQYILAFIGGGFSLLLIGALAPTARKGVRKARSEAVNFGYHKAYSYTERTSYDIQTGDEWTFIPVQATSFMDITGTSD